MTCRFLLLIDLFVQSFKSTQLFTLALIVFRVAVQGVKQPVSRVVGVPRAAATLQAIQQILLFILMTLSIRRWGRLQLVLYCECHLMDLYRLNEAIELAWLVSSRSAAEREGGHVANTYLVATLYTNCCQIRAIKHLISLSLHDLASPAADDDQEQGQSARAGANECCHPASISLLDMSPCWLLAQIKARGGRPLHLGL